ncbi:MAG: DpnD/PcfM family protein [Candidatus Saccharibacteria bacterium]|nr:DpnD/PcfM family protein [Candidatus Saccharibacteria bacterium]
MKYTITIEETVAKDFEIEARGADEAYEIAERKYKSGDFVLDPGRSLNSLINRLEKGDLVSLRLFASQGASEKDILARNMVSNLEIDAQKKGDLQI